MNPLLWIPCLVALSTLQAYASTRNNLGSSPWGWVLWLSGLVPVWLVVSRGSKNLMWDVLAYDTTVFVTWGVAAGFMTGCFQAYGWIQWTGLVLITAGFFLLHVPIK